MTNQTPLNRKLELWLALLLTAAILCLHTLRLFKAGALWRDEAAAVGLATMSPLNDVIRYFPHEAFPLVVPAAIRTVACVSANSDLGFRGFGMLVGVAIIAALWWTLRSLRRRPPLLALALLGFNSPFIIWGDSVRGYGLGTLFIILTVGLAWRLVQQPSRSRLVCATLAAVAAVQCLLHNAPLLLALGCAGIAVAWRRRNRRAALLVLVPGVMAAVSLLPYWGLLQSGRGWDAMVRKPVPVQQIGSQLLETLAASGLSNAWVCALPATLSARWTTAATQSRARRCCSSSMLITR